MGFFFFLLFLFLFLLFFIHKYVSTKQIPSSSSSSASAAAAASSTINNPPRKYDVFLSFRGEDTRNSFTGHLYEALLRNNIETFIDNQLIRGDEISQSLLNAIEGSTISIIIFSEHYASSRWCLDELVKILECKSIYGQIVIPIFYHVLPSHVRNQTGNFGDSFSKLEKHSKERLEKLQKWRVALKEAANLSGFDSSVIRFESEFIEKIVKDILKKLKDMFPSNFTKDLVGVESHIEEIESLLSHRAVGVYMLGIWGIGGIGKTTIARAFFNKISNQFEGSCFISNIREESEKVGGLTQLQKEFLFTLLGEGNLNVGFKIFDFTFEITRLSRKKVLIVFDDVTSFQQIEFLIKSFDRLVPGSLIIVTTRDKSVLKNCEVKIIYEMKKLADVDALKLFSWHAFKRSHPDVSYEKLSKNVIQYAQGIPLVLKVLGCFLHRRSRREWESEINKLQSIPPNEIQKVLKVSYDALDDTNQKIFLDIACFLKGENKHFVVKFLDASGLFAEIGIGVLVDRSLIAISDDNKVTMHDLLQEMGRNIVRQESIEYPENRSRLWHHEDVYEVLTSNTGTQAIQGISLCMNKVEETSLNFDIFKQMRNLRFLKFYGKNKFKINDFGSKGYTFGKLRYLQWDQYPSRLLPSNFRPENLVFLNLCESKIEQLWDGVQNLVNLKEIDLSHSKQLTKLPNLSKAQNIEKLILEGCSSLVEIHSSIQYLKKLLILDLFYCKSLSNLKRLVEILPCNLQKLILDGTAIEELPSSVDCLSTLAYLGLQSCKRLQNLPSNLFNLKSLRSLWFPNCSNLKSLPEISSCDLEMLWLDGIAIEELPSSIDCLSTLGFLSLSNCKRLQNLPSNVFNLQSLKSLLLSNCSNLKSLPEISSCDLEELYLNGTAIEELPSSIDCLLTLVSLHLENCKRLQNLPSNLFNLKSLRFLSLSNCSNLKSLPEISSCDLERLYLDGTAIEKLPLSIEFLSRLNRLDLHSCSRLNSLPNSLCKLKSLADLYLNDCSNLQRLPEEIHNLDSLKVLHIQRTAITELPSSIVCLKNLSDLSLERIRGHEQMSFILLPSVSLDGLQSLKGLRLIDCGITELPKSLFELSTLESLSLDKNKFKRLPKSIINLSKLQWLSLRHCERLQSLPNLPSSLKYMNADHCSSLESFSGSSILFKTGPYSRDFHLANCFKLDQNELKKIVNNAQLLSTAELSRGYRTNSCSYIYYPGSEIPDFFKFQSPGSSLTLPTDVLFSSDSVGFAFCVIVSFGEHRESDQDFRVICELKVKTEIVLSFTIAIIDYVKAEHVIFGYTMFSKDPFDFLENGCNNEAVLEFYLKNQRIECCDVVKKCGIHIIFNNVSLMKKKKDLAQDLTLQLIPLNFYIFDRENVSEEEVLIRIKQEALVM